MDCHDCKNYDIKKDANLPFNLISCDGFDKLVIYNFWKVLAESCPYYKVNEKMNYKSLKNKLKDNISWLITGRRPYVEQHPTELDLWIEITKNAKYASYVEYGTQIEKRED